MEQVALTVPLACCRLAHSVVRAGHARVSLWTARLPHRNHETSRINRLVTLVGHSPGIKKGLRLPAEAVYGELTRQELLAMKPICEAGDERDHQKVQGRCFQGS